MRLPKRSALGFSALSAISSASKIYIGTPAVSAAPNKDSVISSPRLFSILGLTLKGRLQQTPGHLARQTGWDCYLSAPFADWRDLC